ncbi:MAG TPA: hypothetical protein P5514_11425 [Bacteroidales bacterium]|nr:hypothetical protein [Bacteroidales bacterium]HRX97548.1 hypothetical protein [Bacteroidales bacterium]
MIKNRSYIFLLLLFVFACQSNTNRLEVDVSDVADPNVKIKRYGEALFNIDTTQLLPELKRLQPDFPVFLEGDLNNPVSLNRILNFVQDTLLISVYEDVEQTYPDLDLFTSQLNDAVRHLKYYFPKAPDLNAYTYISGFDYEHPVQLYENNLLIALDMYLGGDYWRYKQLGIPLYILPRFSSDYLARDCMFEIASSMIHPNINQQDVLSQMIYQGKLLWFVKAMIPNLEDRVLLDYTPEGLAWAGKNEGLVWAFMIENQMLYSAESTTVQKFIGEAPFTSFFGKDSPPRLGWFTGYRIVDAYMQKNSDISLGQLIREENAQKILKASAYKPEL